VSVDRAEIRPEQLTRIVLRPYASPLPLGFLALGVGSCLLSALQLGWISVAETHQAALAVLVLVAPLELVTCIVAFVIRDVVMATGLGLLFGSWAAVGLLLDRGAPGATSSVMGVLAIAMAVALLVPAATAIGSKPVAAVLMTVAATRFAFTAVYELHGGSAWKQTSGVIGIILAVTAVYGSLALALEDAHHRAILPLSRRGTSYYAMSGDLAHQLEPLPTEVGVRQES
jgi:uncharacterized protein